MMTEMQKEKARQTREEHKAARTALYREQREAIRVARMALQRVFESPDATTEQVLEAAKLLAKLSNH